MTRNEIAKRVRDALSRRLDLPHNPDAEAVLVQLVEDCIAVAADEAASDRLDEIRQSPGDA